MKHCDWIKEMQDKECLAGVISHAAPTCWNPQLIIESSVFLVAGEADGNWQCHRPARSALPEQPLRGRSRLPSGHDCSSFRPKNFLPPSG